MHILFWLSKTWIVHFKIWEYVFSGCTVPPDNKEAELGSSNKEASPSEGKNARVVLVPCSRMVVWIFLRSLGVICYGRWILSEGHKNYFKDWCLINPYLFLTYLNLWIMAIHGSEKLGWLFLHDFIKNFGKYQTFRHCLIICMFGVILHPLWGPKWNT